MISTALLLMLLAHSEDAAEKRPMDQARFQQASLGAVFDWSDAEDRVRATVRPGQPRAGQALAFELQVGSFQGPPYDGPVVLQLRPPEAGPLVTVPLEKKPAGWSGTATLETAGDWTVDLRFRTTHNKHVQAPLTVKPRFVVPWAELTVIAALAAALAAALYRATSDAASRRHSEERAAAAGPAEAVPPANPSSSEATAPTGESALAASPPPGSGTP